MAAKGWLTGREPDMSIRLAGVEDAAVLDHFFQQLDRETRFMLFEAGERPSDIQGQRQRLEAPIRPCGCWCWTGRWRGLR